MRLRCAGVASRQLDRMARSDDTSARFTSSLAPAAKLANTFPVPGSIVSMHWPPTEGLKRPSMKCPVGRPSSVPVARYWALSVSEMDAIR